MKQTIYNIRYKENVFNTTSVGIAFSTKKEAEEWIKNEPPSDMYVIEELVLNFKTKDFKKKKKQEKRTKLFPIENLLHETMSFDDLDIYTIDDFIECVKDGFFTDYDGSGCPVYETEKGLFYEDISIDLEEITRKKHFPFTKVVWFNR